MDRQSTDLNNSKAIYFAFRLTPHQDLKKELMAFAKRIKMKAGFVATCVGSLEQVSLRYANQEKGEILTGYFEIVSLTGTLADGSAHLHIALADSHGRTLGGHLLEGSLIYTTAELVIGELTQLAFSRSADTTYGYNELIVTPVKSNND